MLETVRIIHCNKCGEEAELMLSSIRHCGIYSPTNLRNTLRRRGWAFYMKRDFGPDCVRKARLKQRLMDVD